MDFLRTSSEEYFDNFTYLASSMANCPVAVITFIEENKVWLKSRHGMQVQDTLDKGSFTEAVLEEKGILIVEDCSKVDRFKNNQFVKDGIRFVLGIPIFFENKIIGTLSVGDYVPRTLEEKVIQQLIVLTKQLEREIERIVSTHKIAESENRYKSVTQSINDAVITCDESGAIVSWNKAASLIFGYSEEEALKNDIHIIVPDEYRSKHLFAMNDFVSKKGNRPSNVIGKTLELVGLRKDGTVFPLELSVSFWMNNETMMLTAILRDITQRKNYLKELADAKENLEIKVSERTADLKIFMESIPEIIWEAKADGSISYMSPKWTQITGRPHNESSWDYFIHPEDLEYSIKVWEDALINGQTFEVEYRLRQSDGTFRWTMARAVPQVIDGKVTKWFGSLTDIHEKRIVNNVQNNFFALPDLMLCLAGPDGYFKKINASWANLLGHTEEELLGTPFIEFVHKDDIEKTKFEASKLAEGRGSVNFENRYRCKDGSYVWLHWTSVIRDGLYYCVARDISYLKVSQTVLKESEMRFKSILEQSPIATQLINTEGRISKLNKAWQELWGIDDNDLGSVLKSYNIHTDELMDRLKIREHINQAFKGRAVVVPPVLYDPMTFGRPGRKRWVKVYLNPIFKVDGRLSEVLLMFLDITDQKHAENLIRAKQNELQSILDNSSTVMYMKDPEGHYLLVNSEFERVFNKSSKEVLGKTDEEIFPAEFASRYIENDKFVATHKLAIKEEETAIQEDGVHTYLSSKFPILNEDGGVRAIAGISTDITSHKKYEEEKASFEIREKAAHETSKLKSEFLANMSHEIRTPINGVVGMTGLLLDTSLTEEQRDYTDQIRRSGEILLTVINDILDFSKIEAGKLDFEEANLNLRELITDSLKTVQFSARKKGLELVTDIDPSLPGFVLSDPGRLKQIFLNLLSNAIKFTSDGVVTIRGRLLSEEANTYNLRFEVADTGIGISKTNIEKLFRPFSQADGSTQRKFGGTGLGLSICKKIIEHWNGKIGVESQLEHGSLFWFEIELKKGEAEVQFKVEEKTNVTKKARILIAEDNPVNQLITSKMLKKMGHYSDIAANGFEAVNALRNAPYDIILMDCQMPECDGYEATRIIRTSPEFAKQKHVILAMTANAMSGDAEKCINAGMDGYISKPVSADKLQEILNEWLNKSKLS